MNISDWPIGRIMQLPDWCFGRRYWVGTTVETSSAGNRYFIVEERLPKRFVIWKVLMGVPAQATAANFHLGLRLGNELPVAATFLGLRKLMTGIALETDLFDFHWQRYTALDVSGMKNLVESQGGRIVGVLQLAAETTDIVSNISILISSLPTEVPDWLVLAPDKNR